MMCSEVPCRSMTAFAGGSNPSMSCRQASSLVLHKILGPGGKVVAGGRATHVVHKQKLKTACVACAAGMRLPILAEGVGDIVLRFTEMFAPPPSEEAAREQQRPSEAQQLERQERIHMAASAVSKAPGAPPCYLHHCSRSCGAMSA